MPDKTVLNNGLSDYEYSILDEVRRDEINQALKLQEIVKREKKNPYNQTTVIHADVEKYTKKKLVDYLQYLLDSSRNTVHSGSNQN